MYTLFWDNTACSDFQSGLYIADARCVRKFMNPHLGKWQYNAGSYKALNNENQPPSCVPSRNKWYVCTVSSPERFSKTIQPCTFVKDDYKEGLKKPLFFLFVSTLFFSLSQLASKCSRKPCWCFATNYAAMLFMDLYGVHAGHQR